MPYFKNSEKDQILIPVQKSMTINQRKQLLYQTKFKLFRGIKGAIEIIDNFLFLKSKQKVRVTLDDFFKIKPDINLNSIRCNDLTFVANNFGIEAARSLLFEEIKSVLENEGISICDRHIHLLVDSMSFSGSIQATRYGSININETPILKATFQQGTSTFALAASKNICDNLNSISSQILTGKLAKIGSNCVGVNKEDIEMYDPFNPEMEPNNENALYSPKYESDEDYVMKSPSSEYVPMNSPLTVMSPEFDL